MSSAAAEFKRATLLEFAEWFVSNVHFVVDMSDPSSGAVPMSDFFTAEKIVAEYEKSLSSTKAFTAPENGEIVPEKGPKEG